ncbi:MAG: hypothetical protein QXH42_03765 [Thermoplasmata archaeon]
MRASRTSSFQPRAVLPRMRKIARRGSRCSIETTGPGYSFGSTVTEKLLASPKYPPPITLRKRMACREGPR